jgi:hypothetical protein
MAFRRQKFTDTNPKTVGDLGIKMWGYEIVFFTHWYFANNSMKFLYVTTACGNTQLL